MKNMVEVIINNSCQTKIQAEQITKNTAIQKHISKWRLFHITNGKRFSNGFDFKTKKSAIAFAEHMEQNLDLTLDRGEGFKEDRETCFKVFNQAMKIAETT